jgi:hypothetical protein
MRSVVSKSAAAIERAAYPDAQVVLVDRDRLLCGSGSGGADAAGPTTILAENVEGHRVQGSAFLTFQLPEQGSTGRTAVEMTSVAKPARAVGGSPDCCRTPVSERAVRRYRPQSALAPQGALVAAAPLRTASAMTS